MITLQNKLYESLLDDEEDLINDESSFSISIKEFLESSDFAKAVELTSCYLDDKLKNGGYFTLIPCYAEKYDIPRKFKMSEVLQEIPKDCIKKEQGYGIYYYGTVNINGYTEKWPSILKIGPVFSTTVYSKNNISQYSIPEYSVMFSSMKLSVLNGVNVTCRLFTATFDKPLTSPLNITIKGNLKKMNNIFLRGSELKEWSQMNNIHSNTENLYIESTTLAENIINMYKSNLTKENNVCIFTQTKQFKDILKNFKNLKHIILDVKYSISKTRNGDWELFYNYI